MGSTVVLRFWVKLYVVEQCGGHVSVTIISIMILILSSGIIFIQSWKYTLKSRWMYENELCYCLMQLMFDELFLQCGSTIMDDCSL